MDVFALVTDWEPMVAAYRSAGGFDFYWAANEALNERVWAAQNAGQPIDILAEPELLPYAVERSFWGGFSFLVAQWFYEGLRPHLPDERREAADAFLGMLYPEVCGLPEAPDDLAVDAGLPEAGGAFYAMRPSTVRTAVQRAAGVPWDELRATAELVEPLPPSYQEYVPDFDAFETVIAFQRDWLAEAASIGRGVVVLISH